MSAAPKLLHVVGGSKYGGSTLVVIELARAALDNGFRVSVLATDPVVVRQLTLSGIAVVNADCIRREIRPLFDYRGLRRLTGLINEGNYSIVQTHTSKGGVVGRVAAWKAEVPAVLHTVHGFAVHEASHWLAIRSVAAAEKWAARRCHRIVTVSEFHRRWAIELGIAPAQKIVAIPNGLASERVYPTKDRAVARAELGVASDEIMILSTGRLARQKGLEDLFQSTRLLDGFEVSVRLILAGDGPQADELKADAESAGLSERVSFLGFRSDIGDLLNAADLFVTPSVREGLSISVLEAMAAGKPIVASDIASNREATDQGRVARLVPTGDPQALASAIKELALDPDEAHYLGEQARLHFEESYTLERMTTEYLSLYDELLSTNQRPGR